MPDPIEEIVVAMYEALATLQQMRHPLPEHLAALEHGLNLAVAEWEASENDFGYPPLMRG